MENLYIVTEYQNGDSVTCVALAAFSSRKEAAEYAESHVVRIMETDGHSEPVGSYDYGFEADCGHHVYSTLILQVEHHK